MQDKPKKSKKALIITIIVVVLVLAAVTWLVLNLVNKKYNRDDLTLKTDGKISILVDRHWTKGTADNGVVTWTDYIFGEQVGSNRASVATYSQPFEVEVPKDEYGDYMEQILPELLKSDPAQMIGESACKKDSLEQVNIEEAENNDQKGVSLSVSCVSPSNDGKYKFYMVMIYGKDNQVYVATIGASEPVWLDNAEFFDVIKDSISIGEA